MELVEAYAVAAARAGDLIAATSKDQLGSPTPCPEWTAREVINHLVGGQYMFAGAAAGKPLDLSSLGTDFTAGDAAGAHRDANAALAVVLADPELGQRMAELPFGTLPAGLVPGLACYEAVVHSWDLARATGQELSLPAEVVEAVYPFAVQVLEHAPRDGVAFAAIVDVPASASTLDRLVALSGRKP